SEMHSGDSLVDVFARLWESTGGDWAANPWVWVVEFKRVTP
ncbi:morphogenetic protein, partial [Pseudomonas aeruginosa]